MVNTGGPSQGCGLCRKRRIKCDQKRPGCQKCSIYGADCPGYSDKAITPLRKSTATGRSYVWHTASPADSSSSASTSSDTPSPTVQAGLTGSTFTSSELTSRKTETLSSEVEPPTQSTDDNAGQSATVIGDAVHSDFVLAEDIQSRRYSSEDHLLSHISSSTTGAEKARGYESSLVLRYSSPNQHFKPLNALRAPPQQDVQDLAICHFFTSGTLPIFQSIGLGFDYDRIIGQLYTTSPDPALRQAVKAAALVNYANRYRPERCEDLVFTQYGRAIKSLNTALSDPRKKRKDESLLAALMVAVYEFYVAINPSWTIKNWTHHGEGVRALLRVRGEEMKTSEAGKWLFMLVHLGSNWVSLLSGRPAAEEMLFKMEDEICLDYLDSAYAARTAVRTYFNEVTKLQARVNAVLGASTSEGIDAGTVAAFLQEVQMLHASIGGWSEIVTGWQRLSVVEKPLDYTFSNVLAVYYYKSLTVFLHHLMIFVSTIRLHECAVHLLRAYMQRQEQRQVPMLEEAIQPSPIINDHVDVIRNNISELLGSLAYGLGDIDEHGRAHTISSRQWASSQSAGTNGDGYKLRSMEIFVPLSAVLHGEHFDLRQRAAARAVLQRIQDEFRAR